MRQHGRGAPTGLAHTVGGGATVDTLRDACTRVKVHRLVYLHARYFCDPRCCCCRPSLFVVVHCLVLGLLFTLSKKVRDKRERTREHYYYSWRSMCASGTLFLCFPPYALLPLLTPCDKYNTAIVPEGGAISASRLVSIAR